MLHPPLGFGFGADVALVPPATHCLPEGLGADSCPGRSLWPDCKEQDEEDAG